MVALFALDIDRVEGLGVEGYDMKELLLRSRESNPNKLCRKAPAP